MNSSDALSDSLSDSLSAALPAPVASPADDRGAAAGADAPLAPGPELTIAHAAVLRDRLLAQIADGRADLALDLSGVTDIDSAGVQLLVAARRSMAERGGTLRLAAPSTPVRDALHVFGLQALAETGAAA